jgi:hypothetical protein
MEKEQTKELLAERKKLVEEIYELKKLIFKLNNKITLMSKL